MRFSPKIVLGIDSEKGTEGKRPRKRVIKTTAEDVSNI